ncbi:hypothetical protein EX895_006359 [Sporisorium graminicola]|uniref:Uncharacterized protein n=1 Tax=Sporisorium graminicola TaxID=280036 RepID=A0A4V6ETI0_9BASI|nr:hypothetical protein EX895_006359 [Sporisorium graminicola]TKY85279.1 hypothetical protein EX895_006359 [Sporisorium graminicola]
MAAAGSSSPRPSHNRPWDSPLGHEQSLASTCQDSAEEDELSDEIPLQLQGHRSPGPQRRLSTKRKTEKVAAQPSSPKRSKRAATDLSPNAKSSSSYRLRTPSRGSSPQARSTAALTGPSDELAATGPSARLLSPDEIDTFLDLIYKHHPEPMTAETMRQSVDALYRDWEQFCAQRQVPVRLAKKPLMDEYGKIFNGVYGPDSQAKARSIAHELSQRSANSSAGRDFADAEGSARRGSGSRYSGTNSMISGDTNDEEDEDDEDEDDVDQGVGTTAGDAGAQSFVSKKKLEKGQDVSEGNQPEKSSKNSNIAQVGRNGLAVLPPGLFDILRAHLRDDILSSIMPSVRNDLTEQTRELFLQNQDLFGRIKEMEDRIRNQDLWIRHLLSRDPSDLTSPPGGPHASATGLASADQRSKPFPAAARESAHFGGRPPRQGPLGSDFEMGPGVPMGDFFDGPGSMSPYQNPRNEAGRGPPPGSVGPHPFEGRMPPGAAGAGMQAGPNMSAASVFGSGRREADAHPSGGYRERPPPERRPSYASEASHHHRPGSWQGEMQPGRDPRLHTHPSERNDAVEARYEPPMGPVPGQHRLSVGDARRLNSFAGGNVNTGGPRGAAPPSTGSAPSIGSMQDEFRRPGAPTHTREPIMSPVEPTCETRRPPPGLPMSQSEAYFGGAEANKAPLPPRAMAAASPEQVQRNKRGRPSKAEMATSRGGGGELGTGGRHGSFGGSSHPSAPSRPYLS